MSPCDVIGGNNFFSGQIRSDYISLERFFDADSESNYNMGLKMKPLSDN